MPSRRHGAHRLIDRDVHRSRRAILPAGAVQLPHFLGVKLLACRRAGSACRRGRGPRRERLREPLVFHLRREHQPRQADQQQQQYAGQRRASRAMSRRPTSLVSWRGRRQRPVEACSDMRVRATADASAAQSANLDAMPPRPIMHATSIQPGSKPKAGSTVHQARSTSIATSRPATPARPRPRSLHASARAAERTAARNGRAAMSSRTAPQKPRDRARYHGASAARIGLPDDQQLHEIEIDPQHDQGEQQLAEVLAHGRRDVARGQQHRRRQRQQPHAGRGDHPVDRRDEMRIERHRRVDRGEGRGERQHEQAGRRDRASGRARARSASRARATAADRPRRAREEWRVEIEMVAEVRLGRAHGYSCRRPGEQRQRQPGSSSGSAHTPIRSAGRSASPQRPPVSAWISSSAMLPSDQAASNVDGGQPAAVEPAARPAPSRAPAIARPATPRNANAAERHHCSAAFCSGVRSASFAFWLRCSARI